MSATAQEPDGKTRGGRARLIVWLSVLSLVVVGSIWAVMQVTRTSVGGVVVYSDSEVCPLDSGETGPLGSEGCNGLGTPNAVPDAPVTMPLLVWNAGSEDLFLEAVRLHDSENMTLVGVRVAGPERSGTYLRGEGFPPDHLETGGTGEDSPEWAPVEGYRVLPMSELSESSWNGYELRLGLEFSAPRGSFKGVEIDYRVGERRYTLIATFAYAMCEAERNCEVPELESLDMEDVGEWGSSEY